jgi:phosphatidylserine decarboxylase
MSVKQGKKYDSPLSAAEIPAFIAFHKLNIDEIRDPLDSFSQFNLVKTLTHLPLTARLFAALRRNVQRVLLSEAEGGSSAYRQS